MPAILKPGRNCWRIERAERAAFLIDGEAYFDAFRAAIALARHSILILCWDIDTRVRTFRRSRRTRWPVELGDLLRAVLRRRPALHAHVLAWDYHPIYAMEREWLSLLKLRWGAGRRLHVHLDGDHPAFASHHQKVIVVDDALAFIGGLDPTKCRWDTPQHHADDPRRVDADGAPYPPLHDVQLMLSGDAARALGDLARERWSRATGERLPPPPRRSGALWPVHIRPDFTHIDVGLARTEPAMPERPEVREVEALYLDSIATAKRAIYMETQYFTCSSIADALAARLEEPHGPELVLLVHPTSPGWLEHQTMDVLRGRAMERLRKADRHGRLGIYYPDVPGLRDCCLTVHSKVMVIDDEFVRVGSSNISNRSMGLDTECDAAIEAHGDLRLRDTIAIFRNRLLAEHLDVRPEEVAAAVADKRSLLAAVESLRGRPRTLRVYDNHHVPDDAEALIPDPELVDPERPFAADAIAERLMPPEQRKDARARIVIGGLLMLALLGLAAAWRWTPMKEWLDVDTLVQHATALQNTGLAGPAVVGAFVLGGLTMVPVTLLIVAAVIAFGPWFGLLYSFIGMTASALAGYGVGRALGHDLVRRVAGSRIGRLSQRLAKRGLLAIITVRIVPVAPFTVVNLVAGASHITFRHFALGTVIGETPGLLAMSVFGQQVGDALQHPGPKTWAVLAAVGAAVLAVMWGLRRWLEKRES